MHCNMYERENDKQFVRMRNMSFQMPINIRLIIIIIDDVAYINIGSISQHSESIGTMHEHELSISIKIY